jgi:hypothetical protein
MTDTEVEEHTEVSVVFIIMYWGARLILKQIYRIRPLNDVGIRPLPRQRDLLTLS